MRETLVAMVSRESPLVERRAISVEDLRHSSIIASRLKDCRFHQPFLHELLAPYGITPKIVESPQSCSVQLAYAAAGEGVAITTSSMATCAFPHVVALPFAESLPQIQLGLAAMESNDSASLRIFRKVVMDCARSTLAQRESALPLAVPHAAMHVMSRRAVS